MSCMSLAAFRAEIESELGYTESPAGSNKTKFAAEAGHSNGQPWCATFLVAIARRTGLQLPSESAYTPTMANGFKKVGVWHTGKPQLGDIGFIDFPGDSKKRIQHCVWVVGFSADGRTVATIEGNTSAGTSGSQDNGGGVYRRKRDISLFVGFGRPDYAPAPPADDLKERIMAKPVLSEGAEGHDVTILQSLLIGHDRGAVAFVTQGRTAFDFVDGDFGPATTAVLKHWQGATGVLAVDGVCGPATWAWLVGVS